MQTQIMSFHTPSVPGVGPKGHNILLLKVVMLHIKLKGMEHQAPWKPYSALTRTFNPQIRSKGQNFFSESSQCEYQIKGIGA